MIVDGEGRGMAGFDELDIWAKKGKARSWRMKSGKNIYGRCSFALMGPIGLKRNLCPKGL